MPTTPAYDGPWEVFQYPMDECWRYIYTAWYPEYEPYFSDNLEKNIRKNFGAFWRQFTEARLIYYDERFIEDCPDMPYIKITIIFWGKLPE